MKKLFISMTMRGKDKTEIISSQAVLLSEAEKYLGEKLIQIDTFLDEICHNDNPLKCLGESIKRMSGADYVLFADGFESARGCRVEHNCAMEYDKKILIEHGNVIQEEL